MTKVFVAGATGVLGKRAVKALVEAGHQVTAVARTAEKAEQVRAAGARPVTIDLFDVDAVTAAVAGHDVVVNLATHIPPLTQAAMPGAWKENDRIRTDASRNLVDAAIAGGATKYVQESITFTYPDKGDEWIDESVSIEDNPFTKAPLAAEANAARFTAAGDGRQGIVLRFGFFYATDATHTVDSVRFARRGLAPTVGTGSSYISSISADDAARAVVAAVERASAGIYNVVDDEPVTRDEYGAAMGAALGRSKRPRLLPAWPMKAGGVKVTSIMRSQRVSNAGFKAATGWAPRDRSVREGFARVVPGVPREPVDWRAVIGRLALLNLALGALMVGLWAQFAPRSWFDSFPGLGRAWVTGDGPYNEHLVRDVGGLNLALGMLTVAALVKYTPGLVRLTAAAYAVYGLPHFVYHVANGAPTDSLVSLFFVLALCALVVWMKHVPAGRGERSLRHADFAAA